MPNRYSHIARALERWFDRSQRPLPWRATYDPWHVWVSEVMAQQTRLSVVLDYFEEFIGRFPTVHSLATATEAEALAAWSGLGYYRRARMLHRGAIEVVERFGGTIPCDVPALLTLPGIGRYTAGAIASIAFEVKAPIVDGNIMRVASRVERIGHATGTRQLEKEAWSFAGGLVEVSRSPRALNQGVMELGALVCTPRNPECDHCVVRRWCRALEANEVDQLPRPRVARDGQDLKIPLFVVLDDRGYVLLQKTAGTLMDSMYHLPHGTKALIPDAEPGSFEAGESFGSVRHTVTHRRIEFDVRRAAVAAGVREGSGDYRWVDPARLAEVPHPSYVEKALALVFGD